MREPANADILDRAALRAAARPFFLASAFREFQTLHHLRDVDLAGKLKCSVETLVALGLCRRPAPEAKTFRTDVTVVAERFEIEALQLAQILREVASAEAMRAASESLDSAVLMAARDRKASKTKRVRRREP